MSPKDKTTTEHATHELFADFSKRAVVDTAAMAWTSSPGAKVWRKRLELQGPLEAGRVTSIVRYDPNSQFPSHPHPQGEEILVLNGVFSDESGDYPVGSFVLNPEGFEHAPFSREGCTLLVKLRQSSGPRKPVCINIAKASWQEDTGPGVQLLPLYSDPKFPESTQLVRAQAAVHWNCVKTKGGREIFVMDGILEDEMGRYPAGTWLRLPPGASHTPYTRAGCTFYVKSNHLLW